MRTRWRLRAALATITVLAGLGVVPHARADQAPAASADTPEEAAVAPIRLVPVTGGLDTPLFLTSARDGSGRLFALERSGRVRIIEGGKPVARPFLDLSGRVLAGGEQGLLGLAFHPGYRTNGRFFVDYTRKPDGATVVAEYHASSDPDVALSSGRTVLIVRQPFANHNGGALAFGPDGRLYIGLGDGGSEGDPGNRAQDRDVLLGKVLRIGVDGAKPYAIPPDNPFVGRPRPGRDLRARLPQPVAVLVRPRDGPALRRRRRAGPGGGGRHRPAGRQLRLADRGGEPVLLAGERVQAGGPDAADRHLPTHGRALRDHGRVRLPGPGGAGTGGHVRVRGLL